VPLFAFATIGVQTAPGANFDVSGVNLDNEIANPPVAVPLPGAVRQISTHFGGNGAGVTARCVIWDSAGTLIAKSPQFAAPAAPALQTQTPDSQAIVKPGTTYQIGFWRAPGGSGKWFITGSGTFNHNTDAGVDVGSFAGAGACGGAYLCDNIQAYALVVGVAPQAAYYLGGMAIRKKRAR
jgi:hypothetical protein